MQRSFKTKNGLELQLLDIKGKPYLSVQSRVMWFREENPLFTIETEFIKIEKDYAIAKATIKDALGRILATGHKHEDRQGFPDFHEKSESAAIGRALGFLGYGTQFALDLEEGDRLADSPVEKKTIFSNTTLKSPTESQSLSSKKEPLFPKDEDDIASFRITFGKYKDKTIAEIMLSDSPQKVLSYCEWLETDANVKKKPISENAQDFIHAARAYVEELEVPKNEELGPKLARLKNTFPPTYDESEVPWPESP